MMYWICLILFAYLIGSIPSGLWLARIFASVDLREIGSGNIGATNARRAGGWPMGIATLICDMAKGAIPVGLAVWLAAKTGSISDFTIWATGIAAVTGHLFPIYLGFQTGGKGVATAAGCFLVLSPPALAVAIGLFIATVAASRRVSAGSLAAAATLPVTVYLLGKGVVATLAATAIALMVIGRHRQNIGRLIAGTEPKLSDKGRGGGSDTPD
ncbi:MAG: glycerol-3-phosphate 1-O-acyltransferase PlsY [Thermodesulfobacteriota bacterium]